MSPTNARTNTPSELKKDDGNNTSMPKDGIPPKINNTSFVSFCPDTHNTRIAIPEALSVNLFLRNLPADCTTRTLLDSIWGYGRIWSVRIHPPSPWNHAASPPGLPVTPTATATLSFFEVAAARRFVLHTEARGALFLVGGRHVRVSYHPRRMAGKEALRVASRCVLVQGHPDMVNETSLLVLLRSRLLFLADRSLAEIRQTVVEARLRYITTRGHIVELRFHDGFYGRAGLAVDVLRLEDNPRISAVGYGEDPCA
ncbi:uncharacterized protein PG998_012465 [Apiospora kogelbergensis]